MALSLLAAIGTVLLVRAVEGPTALAVGLGVAIPLLVAAAAHARSAALARTRAAHADAVCDLCGTGLSGLAAEGNCPGCSRAYSRFSLRAIWQRWDRSAGMALASDLDPIC